MYKPSDSQPEKSGMSCLGWPGGPAPSGGVGVPQGLGMGKMEQEIERRYGVCGDAVSALIRRGKDLPVNLRS